MSYVRCKNPEHDIRYNERYDSYWCVQCDEWTESKCSDNECDFCYNRPSKPSEVNDDQK